MIRDQLSGDAHVFNQTHFVAVAPEQMHARTLGAENLRDQQSEFAVAQDGDRFAAREFHVGQL